MAVGQSIGTGCNEMYPVRLTGAVCSGPGVAGRRPGPTAAWCVVRRALVPGPARLVAQPPVTPVRPRQEMVSALRPARSVAGMERSALEIIHGQSGKCGFAGGTMQAANDG